MTINHADTERVSTIDLKKKTDLSWNFPLHSRILRPGVMAHYPLSLVRAFVSANDTYPNYKSWYPLPRLCTAARSEQQMATGYPGLGESHSQMKLTYVEGREMRRGGWIAIS